MVDYLNALTLCFSYPKWLFVAGMLLMLLHELDLHLCYIILTAVAVARAANYPVAICVDGGVSKLKERRN